jgi:hypothetical protein
MSLRRVDGPPGAPWDAGLAGRLDVLTVVSEVLEGNPLGDPARRPLYVYIPEGTEGGARYPVAYVIQGYTGRLDAWTHRGSFEPNMFERLDRLFADPATPRGIVVFVDAWTALGGSQFINSTATGRYMDYLCDEVVPFIDQHYPTLADASHRGLTGKSSGGYGAMVVPMLRPDVFRALASHAGDALFETCYLPEFPATVRKLRDKFEGSYEVFFKRFNAAERFDYELYGPPLEMYAMAACYSPDEDNPGQVFLPVEIDTGRLVDEIWERWLEWDPVRMAPRRAEALASMRLIYLDAGRSDDFYLDLGAQAFSNELTTLGVEHHLEFFDGTHMGLQYRYPGAIRRVIEALTD